MFRQMIRQVYHAETYSLTGKIENIVGMSIEASGGQAAVGDICRIYNGISGRQQAENAADEEERKKFSEYLRL